MLKLVEVEGAAGSNDTDADFLTIKGETVGGSQLEFLTDGTLWYVTAMVNDTAAVTVDT